MSSIIREEFYMFPCYGYGDNYPVNALENNVPICNSYPFGYPADFLDFEDDEEFYNRLRFSTPQNPKIKSLIELVNLAKRNAQLMSSSRNTNASTDRNTNRNTDRNNKCGFSAHHIVTSRDPYLWSDYIDTPNVNAFGEEYEMRLLPHDLLRSFR